MIVDDDLKIRELTARFADSINRCDRAAFESLWWVDGVWELTAPYAMVESGLPQVLSMFDRLMDGWEFFVQLIHSGVIDIDGERATARWTVREVARAGAKRSYDNFALYDDTIEKRQGEWRFSKRRYCYVWVSDESIPGLSFSLPKDLRTSR